MLQSALWSAVLVVVTCFNVTVSFFNTFVVVVFVSWFLYLATDYYFLLYLHVHSGLL